MRHNRVLFAVAVLTAVLLALPGLAQAAFPGQNGRIAYSHAGDIWTVNPDGTGATQLTSGPAQEKAPSWSPDGRRIAFASTRADPNPAGCSFFSCVRAIDIMDADGTNVHAVVVGTTSLNNPTGPAWSPDGRRIAFARATGRLWTVAADGTDEQELPPSPPTGFEGCRPGHSVVAAWSPDGTRLIANGSLGCAEEPASCVVTIATGATGCELTGAELSYEDFSPDSRWVLVGSSGLFRGLYYFADRSFVELTPRGQALDGLDGNAAWSPDGTTIVFRRDPYFFSPDPPQVYLIDADGGGNLRPLGGPHLGCCYDWQPAPAPRPEDYKNRAKFCKAGRAFWGEQAFAARYGGGSSAYGRCVSGKGAR